MTPQHSPSSPWTGRNDPEDGDHALRMHHMEGKEGTRAALGFACEEGVRRNKGRVGAKEGPAALRKALAGLAAGPAPLPFVDLGDVVVDGEDLEDGQKLLGDHVAAALARFDRLVVFGGGHETAFGDYLGLAKHFAAEKIGIINFDAHLDLRNIGDAGPSSGTPFNQIRNLAPEKFDYLCIGAAQEANAAALFNRAADWQVDVVMDHQLLNGPNAGLAAIDAIAARCDLLYLTIDIDVLPHFQAPGVSAPAARGVSLSVIEALLHHVMKKARTGECALPLADLVELSPAHDRDGMTARTAAYLARALLLG